MAKRTPGKSLLASGQVIAPTSVDIFYDKASQHRTIYVDGAWATITPSMELQIAFFKNLSPMPEYVRQAITPQDSLGEELESAVKKGMVREYEATIVLSRDTTKALIGLLEQTLKKSEAIGKGKKTKKR